MNHVGSHRVADSIPRRTSGRCHVSPDCFHYVPNLARHLLPTQLGYHGATISVAEHDDQRNTEEPDAVLQGSPYLFIDDVAEDLSYDEVAKSLVEYDFR